VTALVRCAWTECKVGF